jgi:hypothetical protein
VGTPVSNSYHKSLIELGGKLRQFVFGGENVKRFGTRFSLILFAIGFVAAAAYYWRWWPDFAYPLVVPTQFACPVCPHIDGIGSDLGKFVGRTLVFGPINGLLMVCAGWIVFGALRLLKRRRLFPEA